MDNKLRRVFDQAKPSRPQKEAMLARLLEPERKMKPMDKLKKLSVLGIAAALMATVCAAAVAAGIDQRVMDYLGIGRRQAELLAPGAALVDAAAEDNGATFHAAQVLMDRHMLLILAEFTAPEGVALDNKGDPFLHFRSFELNFLNDAGAPCSDGSLSNWAFTIKRLEDEDPADNHMTALIELRLDKGVDYQNASFFRFSFTDFGWFDPDILEFVPLYSGSWSCDIPLPREDLGQTWEPGAPVGEVDGAAIRLKTFYLSPMTLQITLERDIPISFYEDDAAVRHRWQDVLDGRNSVVLTDRDGQAIPLRGGGGSAGFQEQERIYHLTEITDLERLQGGTLTVLGHSFPLDGLIPAAK